MCFNYAARGDCDGRRNLVFRAPSRKINSFGRGPNGNDIQNNRFFAPLRMTKGEDGPPAAGRKQKSPGSKGLEALEKPQLPTLPPGGAVPSAMVSLTSLFGMGRGGSSPL